MTGEETSVILLRQLIAEQEKINGRLTQVEDDIRSIKDAILRMDNDYGKKITALFDGYMINYDILR